MSVNLLNETVHKNIDTKSGSTVPRYSGHHLDDLVCLEYSRQSMVVAAAAVNSVLTSEMR